MASMNLKSKFSHLSSSYFLLLYSLFVCLFVFVLMDTAVNIKVETVYKHNFGCSSWNEEIKQNSSKTCSVVFSFH